jgi:diacylglycerol kinase family enzyme
MFAAPDAELDDGQLDVVLCSASGVLRFLRILTRIFKGTHVELDTITVLRATSVRISADRPFTIYADGDPIGELPATIRAVPHALKVLCPAGS